MIRSFENQDPVIAQSAYVDDAALVIGRVRIGEGASIWPMTVLRGDVECIEVGDRTNIQDGTVVHVTHQGPYHKTGIATSIGSGVTVGHQAMLHACTIGDHCLIGMAAIVMDEATISPEVMVAAGSLVPPGKHLESGYLYQGRPAVAVRRLTDDELAFITYSADHYHRLALRHAGQLPRP